MYLTVLSRRLAALVAALMLSACIAPATGPDASSSSAPTPAAPPAPATPAPAPEPMATPPATPAPLVRMELPPLLAKRTQSATKLQPQSIWALTYQGKPAFYVVEACCDRFNTLHDAAGYARCSPSSGIAGRGDGNCPAPLPPRDQMQLVWERARR